MLYGVYTPVMGININNTGRQEVESGNSHIEHKIVLSGNMQLDVYATTCEKEKAALGSWPCTSQ